MRENRTSGTAWGVPGNRHSYHDVAFRSKKLRIDMQNVIRTILVLPAAILAWLLTDFLVPLVLNVVLFISSIIRLAPFLETIISPQFGGYHFVVFFSYLTAVWVGAHTSPTHKSFKAAIVVGVLFALFRTVMTISVFRGATFTDDTPSRFLIGTLAAIGGLSLGVWLEYHRRFQANTAVNIEQSIR